MRKKGGTDRNNEEVGKKNLVNNRRLMNPAKGLGHLRDACRPGGPTYCARKRETGDSALK